MRKDSPQSKQGMTGNGSQLKNKLINLNAPREGGKGNVLYRILSQTVYIGSVSPFGLTFP